MRKWENNNYFERNKNNESSECKRMQKGKINGEAMKIILSVMKEKWKHWFPPLLAILVYANGLTGDFVHDDIFAIKRNRDVTGRNPLADVFFHDFWGTPMSSNSSHKSYRPLTTLTFRYEFQITSGVKKI